VALGVALVALALVALVRHLRSPSLATLGVCIAAATLAPTANLLFPSGVLLAGRCLYAPSIGVALAGGSLIMAARSWPLNVRRATSVATLCWVSAGAWWSVRETSVWHDADTLGAAMLARQPRSYRTHVYVAEIARARGDAREALPHYRVAVGLFPRDAHQLYSAASTALVTGDTASALKWLERAIMLAPDNWQARTRAVKLALAQRDSAQARALLDDGLQRMPDQRAWRAWRSGLGPSNGTP
jgi:tetratricopeptide (TPR) repeat protein